jgi:hypothetical protein
MDFFSLLIRYQLIFNRTNFIVQILVLFFQLFEVKMYIFDYLILGFIIRHRLTLRIFCYLLNWH